jgi:Mating-type protein MAT alpha 1 HMG-box
VATNSQSAYYSTIFSEIQQKQRSGYLTRLWQADQSKDKWALVARVYSFIRDELGKSNAPLAPFLAIACPAMNIVAAEAYLETLGWTLVGDDSGELKMSRSLIPTSPQDEEMCATDFKLLSTCLARGYTVNNAQALLDKIAFTANSMMVVAQPRVSEKHQDTKADFLDTIKQDPFIAAAKLLGIPTNDSAIQLGVDVVMVDNIVEVDIFDAKITGRKFSHSQAALPTTLDVDKPAFEDRDRQGMMQFHCDELIRPQVPIIRDSAFQPHDPLQEYQFSTSTTGLFQPDDPVLDLDAVPDFAGIDIANPFDVDSVLGYYCTEGERST